MMGMASAEGVRRRRDEQRDRGARDQGTGQSLCRALNGHLQHTTRLPSARFNRFGTEEQKTEISSRA
jgi:hypothetical protein